MASAGIFWIVAAVVFGIIEAATVALITVWFAVGAVAAAVAAQLGGSVLSQVLTFVLVSGVLLIVTRPMTNKFFVKKTEKTNADRLIGCEALVISPIDSIEGMGQVKIGGQVWAAVSESGESVAEGETVKVLGIEGVKLRVSPLIKQKGD